MHIYYSITALHCKCIPGSRLVSCSGFDCDNYNQAREKWLSISNVNRKTLFAPGNDSAAVIQRPVLPPDTVNKVQ